MVERGGKGKYADQNKHFVVHPDIQEAFEEYTGNGSSFATAFSKRNKVLEHDPDMVYWNTDHDEEMLETARERTQQAAARGWKFPGRKK